MKNIDKYKLGRIQSYSENKKNFHSICNCCEKDIYDCRWVCLTCRPGKYQDSGFVDFCDNCMNSIKNKDKNDKIYNEIRNKCQDHENESHIYYRILFADKYIYF